MSFAQEMADLATELLDPAEFGEVVRIERAAAGSYDAATRRRTAGAPIVQDVHGTLDSELTPASGAGGLTARYERVLTAAPTPGGFEPKQQDRVVAEGRTWQVMETGHVIKQGVPILWICGLASA